MGGGGLRIGGLICAGGGRSIGTEFEELRRGYLYGDNDRLMFLFIKKSNRLDTQGFHIFSIFNFPVV